MQAIALPPQLSHIFLKILATQVIPTFGHSIVVGFCKSLSDKLSWINDFVIPKIVRNCRHTEKLFHGVISANCSSCWKISNYFNGRHKILRNNLKKEHEQKTTHQNLQISLVINSWREHSPWQKSQERSLEQFSLCSSTPDFSHPRDDLLI